MKSLIFVVGLACTGQATCVEQHTERHYTVKKWDGTVGEYCAYDHKWTGSNCLVLYDGSGTEKAMMCEVKSAEFGTSTYAEDPR